MNRLAHAEEQALLPDVTASCLQGKEGILEVGFGLARRERGRRRATVEQGG